jgi:hypothetical protein
VVGVAESEGLRIEIKSYVTLHACTCADHKCSSKVVAAPFRKRLIAVVGYTQASELARPIHPSPKHAAREVLLSRAAATWRALRFDRERRLCHQDALPPALLVLHPAQKGFKKTKKTRVYSTNWGEKKPGLGLDSPTSHKSANEGSPEPKHEFTPSSLARRPPRAPCRTSGADAQTPIGTAWWLAAV